MSLAGIRSNRGDAYQRAVALYQVVAMLVNDNITGIEVDALALPQYHSPIYGDDIVILFEDGTKHFIQAKVNQTKHQNWKLTDAVLKKELNSAKLQLLVDDNCRFVFFSRTPFGPLQRLVEERHLYSDYLAFEQQAPQGQKDTLCLLANIWQVEAVQAFALVKRIDIGEHHHTESWESLSLTTLKGYFSNPENALALLYQKVDKQHSKLGLPKLLLERKPLLDLLETRGVYHALSFNESELVKKFQCFSQKGRQWVRTIGDTKIARPELEQLKNAISQNEKSVLLEDVAGGGKTCILLDLVDYLEQQQNVVCLFIKGDWFAAINSLTDLSAEGLPQDLVAQCAHLAEKKQLVVIIDSLDVLAVGRSHKSLGCFLGLIAQLATVTNVTTIAASRSFDAKYDHLLREASWSHSIMLKPLSFERDVQPLLTEWGVAASDLSESMQKLLIIPQNSRLLYSLIRNGQLQPKIEAHDLFEQYIQQVVEQDEMLGEAVLTELQSVACALLIERSYQFARQRLNCTEQQLHRLLSQEVLSEVDNKQFMFSHQTLADALRIRQAQKNGVTLIRFVTKQPQLPFIRPAIRAFILYLRAAQPQMFIRQLRQFLLADDIATHLKRLAVESLAEMTPTVKDLPLIRVLFNDLPHLFNRFLDKANSDAWFQLLYHHWLDKVNLVTAKHNASSVLFYLTKHLDGQEQQLIALWHRAFDEQWLATDDLVWHISIKLEKLTNWDDPAIKTLLVKLFDASSSSRGDIGKAICKYVDATDDGDELLWQYIIADTEPLSTIKRGRDLNFHCNDHELLDKDYFENRLKQSSTFFCLAMDFVLSLYELFKSAKNYRSHFEDSLLHCSSYQKRHTQLDIRAHDSIHSFLYAIEAALIFRAQANDECWQTYEPQLRTSRDSYIRYVLCQAYLVNLEQNIAGIEYQLTDAKLSRYSHLEYELGVLARQAYPYISASKQQAHQQTQMSLYDNVGKDCDWAELAIYKRLIWVPNFFRLPELNDFMYQCEMKYGNGLPAPDIRSGGGYVRPPVSSEVLLTLSDKDLIRLLGYYDQNNEWAERVDGGMVGGRESLQSALSSAASLVPTKFISLIPELCNTNLTVEYIYSIIDGFASHLRCRFGNVSSANWKEVPPLPDGHWLANIILNLVERYSSEDKQGYITSHAIQACCYVLDDEGLLKRLYFQLWRLGGHQNPEPEIDVETERGPLGLEHTGINSVRGVAAESAMIIANKRLKQGLPLDTELIELLYRFAKDPAMAVRATMLRRLPYLHNKLPDLGWQLLNLLANDAHSGLPAYFEQTLYYQYHEHFELVKPFLNTMKNANDEDSAQAWGRLATLAHLAGHITTQELWADALICHETALAGVGQVFIANIDSAKNSKLCVAGLSRLMEDAKTSASVYSDFEHMLEQGENLKLVPLTLINLFIANSPAEHVRELDGIFYWTEHHVLSQPEEVLVLIEAIVSRLQGQSERVYFHRPEALLATLKALLQEADLTDDPQFIERVLVVQDWFMEKSVQELETLLENDV